MRMSLKKMAALLLGGILACTSLPVLAAGQAEVSVNAGIIREGDREVHAACRIKGAGGVTNGKVTIHYDAQKLQLKESTKGQAAADALCEINDCVSGNRQEGEIIAAFAASGPCLLYTSPSPRD